MRKSNEETAKKNLPSDAQKVSQFSKRNFYTIKDSGMVYVLALVLPLVATLVFSLLSVSVAKGIGLQFADGSNILQELFSRYVWFAAVYLLIGELVFLLIWLFYHTTKKISFKATSFSVKKANIWTILVSILVGMIGVLGFVWLMEGCFGRLFSLWKIDTSIGFEINTVGRLFLSLFVLGVVPAVCEELIFRGIIFGGLRKSFGMWTSVLLCGLLFALMHQNIVQLLYPFILGCVLSIVMEKTGNILYTIIIHVVNNFTSIFMTFIFSKMGYTEENYFKAFPAQWWGVLCAIAVAATAVGLLWLMYRFYFCKTKKLEIGETDTTKNSKQTAELSERENKTSDKGKSKSKDAKQEGFVPSYENFAFMIGKIPLTMLCGMILAVIFLVINLFP